MSNLVTTARVKWAASLLLPLLVYSLVDSGIHPKLPLFFAITTWAVTVWALELLPTLPSSAAMTFLFVLCGVATPQVVFAPWGSFLPWLCLAALVLGDALEETGLTRRMALRLMLLVGASFRRVIVALMLTGVFMAFILPDIMCRVIIFVAIAHGLALALDLPPRSRISSALIMAGFCAATSPGYGFLTGTEMALIAMSVTEPLIGPISWSEYALANLPFITLYCAFSVFMCTHLIPRGEHVPEEDHLEEVVRQRLRDMGPMTVQEWKLFVLMVVAIVGLLTQKWHGLPGTYVYAFAGMLCYLPWMGLARAENARHLNVGFIVFVVACLSMGAVAVHLGAAKWIASLLVPFMEQLSPVWSVFTAYLSSLTINFVLTPLAAVSSMSAPMVEIAQALNINPRPMLYAFLYGLDQYIFPYEYILYMYIFSTGHATARHMFLGLGLRMVFAGTGILVIQVPYWSFLGLM